MRCDGPSTAGWIVINTHPNKEEIALANLMRQGFEVYCPRLRKRIRHARRTSDVLRPLFPGYVFAAVDRDFPRWRSCLSTYGVRQVVQAAGAPSFLPDGFIESLQVRELDGAIVLPAAPLRLGQQVRLASGPFDGLIATIVEMDSRNRLVVLLELLNRPVRIKVPVGAVAEIPSR